MDTNQETRKPKVLITGASGLIGGLTIKYLGDKYDFRPGKIYNLDCSRVICNGTGASGAHNDICHPEVAHAVWQAATVVVELAPAPPPPPQPINPRRRPLQRLLERLS